MSRREQIPPFQSPGFKWWEAVEECARAHRGCGTAGAPATCAAEGKECAPLRWEGLGRAEVPAEGVFLGELGTLSLYSYS